MAHRVHTFPMGEWDGQEEWYYLLRVDAFTPRGALSAEELAAENLTATAWYTVELRCARSPGRPARASPRGDAAAFLSGCSPTGRRPSRSSWRFSRTDARLSRARCAARRTRGGG